jgi:hypothetical protein
MTREVGPIPPVGPRDRREAQRRDAADRRAASMSRALVPVSPAPADDAARPAEEAAPHDHAPLDPAAAFAAQLMGQTGQRRGLKGGPPVLDAARSSYLGNEYSGEKDRRPPAGVVKKTDV